MKIRYKLTLYFLLAAAGLLSSFMLLQHWKISAAASALILLVPAILSGYLIAWSAFRPVSEIIAKVDAINASNLDSRLAVKNNKDEISELAYTYNQMLDRLENAFQSQKIFVSNASHEFRTPLSLLSTELQLSLMKRRTPDEYVKVIELALKDTARLVRLANGLLDLAKAGYDQSDISMKEIRLDELLSDAEANLLRSNPEYIVNLLFMQEIENDDYISIYGNRYLLTLAFLNLLENGCKFSEDHQTTVSISYDPKNVILRFSDNGIGIEPEDISKLYTPFYRGANKSYADGNGIGLALTHKIILLHNGSIDVHSVRGAGTMFSLVFPHK
jgi:signal transduction histidine kinase